MANPQPTDAHLRIAHSIFEAIMTRDFTKRQRKILDLILRLSWGCGKKEAYIPYQHDFSVCGLYETDIKQELAWLEASKVLMRRDQFYWFNKDYDQWQVSRVKPFNPGRLSELLSLNLNGNRPELSKTLSPLSNSLSSHNEAPLSKTLSQDLVKHEVNTSQNTKSVVPGSDTPKEILKKDYINNTTTTPYSPPKVTDNQPGPDIFGLYEQEFGGVITPFVAEKLKDWEKEYSTADIVDAMKESVLAGVRQVPYVEAILKRWKAEGKGKRPKGVGRGPSVDEARDYSDPPGFLYTGMSIEMGIEIVEGREQALPSHVTRCREELTKRGIPFKKPEPLKQAGIE